jgi:hypothetical protein
MTVTLKASESGGADFSDKVINSMQVLLPISPYSFELWDIKELQVFWKYSHS